jgi:hypothetical protein
MVYVRTKEPKDDRGRGLVARQDRGGVKLPKWTSSIITILGPLHGALGLRVGHTLLATLEVQETMPKVDIAS